MILTFTGKKSRLRKTGRKKSRIVESKKKQVKPVRENHAVETESLVEYRITGCEWIPTDTYDETNYEGHEPGMIEADMQTEDIQNALEFPVSLYLETGLDERGVADALKSYCEDEFSLRVGLIRPVDIEWMEVVPQADGMLSESAGGRRGGKKAKRADDTVTYIVNSCEWEYTAESADEDEYAEIQDQLARAYDIQFPVKVKTKPGADAVMAVCDALDAQARRRGIKLAKSSCPTFTVEAPKSKLPKPKLVKVDESISVAAASDDKICDFPAWAVDYMVDQDRSSVSRAQDEQIRIWCDDMYALGYNVAQASYGNEEYFSDNPEFGLPCECIEARIPKYDELVAEDFDSNGDWTPDEEPRQKTYSIQANVRGPEGDQAWTSQTVGFDPAQAARTLFHNFLNDTNENVEVESAECFDEDGRMCDAATEEFMRLSKQRRT